MGCRFRSTVCCQFLHKRGHHEGEEVEKILFFFLPDLSFPSQLYVNGINEGLQWYHSLKEMVTIYSNLIMGRNITDLGLEVTNYLFTLFTSGYGPLDVGTRLHVANK
ncbi:unnamed protein product [Lactuca virosa]|uniref:Uncharacterized protein n=1 Tax=Lactuca virosa TaxID=75947 RepID=A0AAU9LE43_9ASTR|nr:unnamed protein product [Lactuca virosa]